MEAAGASAAMPTLQADRPCYTPGERITFTGNGYTPSGNVNFLFTVNGKHGNQVLSAKRPTVADPAGNLRDLFDALDLAPSDDTRETVTATANDQTRLENENPPTEDSFGATTFLLSNFDILVPPWDRGIVNPRRKVTVRAFGYEPSTKLWAHYVLGGKRVATVFVGNLTGPCGDLTKTMREFPFRPVRAGTYAVYFQGSRTLDRGIRTPYSKVRVSKGKAVR
ncbi:MAG: hypothetical protein M3O90_06490 [Actinomycetota bacterium]|nr:hypothetical protein [Actinomycetota bacterium]